MGLIAPRAESERPGLEKTMSALWDRFALGKAYLGEGLADWGEAVQRADAPVDHAGHLADDVAPGAQPAQIVPGRVRFSMIPMRA